MFPMSLPTLDLRLNINNSHFKCPLLKDQFIPILNPCRIHIFYKSLSLFTETSLPACLPTQGRAGREEI